MSDLFGNDKPRVANELLAVYDAEYRARYSVAAPIVGKKDGPLAARLLKRYDFNHLATWLHLFFDVPDKFIQQSGFTFGVFSSCIAKVIQHECKLNVRRIERQPPSQNLLDIRQQIEDEWRGVK